MSPDPAEAEPSVRPSAFPPGRPGPQPWNAGITPAEAPAEPDAQRLAVLAGKVDDVLTWIEGEAAGRLARLEARAAELEAQLAALAESLERITISLENTP